MINYLCKFLMNRIANNGLLQYPWGHSLFGRLMRIRVKNGGYRG